MANITAADHETAFLDALQINVTTDPPIATVASAGSVALSKTYPFLNDAYASLWDISGGSITKATSATLWTPDVTADATGVLAGDLTTVSEILHLWGTLTAGSTGGGSGDIELDRRDLAEVLFWRNQNTGLGTYITPMIYSVHMKATATAADVNKWELNVAPGVTGYYFPAWYVPHFTALAATTDVPDLPDIFQRDMPFLAAYNACDLIGRPDFKASLFSRFSEKTQLGIKRKESAMVDARQDDANR